MPQDLSDWCHDDRVGQKKRPWIDGDDAPGMDCGRLRLRLTPFALRPPGELVLLVERVSGLDAFEEPSQVRFVS